MSRWAMRRRGVSVDMGAWIRAAHQVSKPRQQAGRCRCGLHALVQRMDRCALLGQATTQVLDVGRGWHRCRTRGETAPPTHSCPRGMRDAPRTGCAPGERHPLAIRSRFVCAPRGQASGSAGRKTKGRLRLRVSATRRWCPLPGRQGGLLPCHPWRVPATGGRSKSRAPASRRQRRHAASRRCARSSLRGRSPWRASHSPPRQRSARHLVCEPVQTAAHHPGAGHTPRCRVLCPMRAGRTQSSLQSRPWRCARAAGCPPSLMISRRVAVMVGRVAGAGCRAWMLDQHSIVC
jgi:hypothetical protein